MGVQCQQHMRMKHPKECRKTPRPAKVSDTIEDYRALKDFRQMRREKFGMPCPRCAEEQPRRQPTILEPGQRCRVHRPAYVDPRPELTQADIDTLGESA